MRLYLYFVTFFIQVNLCISLTCYSQLCLEEDSCSSLSTCTVASGYCYNRVFAGQYGLSATGALTRGVESGCSTEFTSFMLGRCAGDVLNDACTCVCSTNLCNEYFLNGSLEKIPYGRVPLRLIQCAEDDPVKCEQKRSQSAPSKTVRRTFCALIKEGPVAPYRFRRCGRTGYWPLIEYAHIAVRETVCIQGLSRDHVIECYCKRDNCNSMTGSEAEKIVRIDSYYPLSKCLMERRFYGRDEVFQLSSNKTPMDEALRQLPLLTCLGHSCYTAYERDLKSSRPWIRVLRGCLNYSRPSAFFDHPMDSTYGPRQRGTRLCRGHLCNNVPVRRLAEPLFRFSGKVSLSTNNVQFLVVQLLLYCSLADRWLGYRQGR